MRTEAWRGFVGDVKRTGRKLKRDGKKYVKTHPLLIVGGGAIAAALLFSRLRRPAPERYVEKSSFLGVLNTARLWMARAISLAGQVSDLMRVRNAEQICPNGCRH